MTSRKATINKKNLIIGVLLLIFGVALGVIIGDIPYITFKREVDLATCIAIAGLTASVFYIPYVVERKFVRMDNINEVIRNDIESIIDDTNRLKTIYSLIKPTIAIKQSTYIEILSLFKTISSSIIALDEELQERARLSDFKKDVYEQKFTPAKDACTEDLMINAKMDARVAMDSIAHLDRLCAELRKYRYKTYSDK